MFKEQSPSYPWMWEVVAFTTAEAAFAEKSFPRKRQGQQVTLKGRGHDHTLNHQGHAAELSQGFSAPSFTMVRVKGDLPSKGRFCWSLVYIWSWICSAFYIRIASVVHRPSTIIALVLGQRGHVGHPKRCQGQPHSSTKGLPVQPEFLYRPKDMVSSEEPPFWRSLGSSRKKILKNWDPLVLVLMLPTEEGHNQRNGPPCPAIFVNPLMSSWLSHLAGSCRQGTAFSFCSPCLHSHIPCPEGKSDLKAG